MQLIPQRGFKSLPHMPGLDLPDLVVITGENGSGKSQFLEAIATEAITFPGGSRESIKFLDSAALGAPQEFAGGEESREAQVVRFENIVRSTDSIRSQSPYDTPAGIREVVHSNLKAQGNLSDETIARLETLTSVPLADWTREEFARHTPVEFGGLDPFNVRVGDVFSRYNQMLMTNHVNRFLASEGRQVDSYTEDEFQAEFGRPPWELFNSALESVGLRYRFLAPPLSASPTTSPPELVDPATGLRLNTSMLSTGERALLTIAMSVYSVTNRRGLMRMPSLVLLDEPDAALHPSMIRSLIALLVENFVNDLGIGVIMTTHSPTTVALSPDQSLYVMHKSLAPRLQPAASKDHALSHLLVGVPTVSVSAENRRVVVVESHHDERRYTAIETLLSPSLNSERSLVFMASSGGGGTNGRAAVVDLVSRLRTNGNVLVWGLVDRDDETVEPHQNVLMNAERYTSENFVLDPVSVGLLLLSEPVQDAVDALAPRTFVSFDSQVDSQVVVDYVVGMVTQAGDDMTRTLVSYGDGLQIELPEFWLQMRGHDLSARIFTAFRSLSSYRDENRLMDAVIAKVWMSRPNLVPASIAATLSRLLN